MNQIIEHAKSIPIYHRPYGFVKVTRYYVGILESYEGMFMVTDGQHSSEGYFSVCDLNRVEGCFSLTILSKPYGSEPLVEIVFSKKSPNSKLVQYQIISTSFRLEIQGIVQILHTLFMGVFGAKPQKYPTGPWVTCLNHANRAYLEINLGSNIETIVSSLQMLTNP